MGRSLFVDGFLLHGVQSVIGVHAYGEEHPALLLGSVLECLFGTHSVTDSVGRTVTTALLFVVFLRG